MEHTLPVAIEAAIENFRNHSTGLSLHSVAHAVSEAAKACPPLDDAEKNALNAELDAFNLSGENDRTSDWGCHFGPIYTVQGNDGRTYQYSPAVPRHLQT